MGKIVILDENTANKIAAGEVVERPASVVKELCENSIDAGATSISVEIKNGGIALMKIVDNGSGISKDDIEIAFEKHSTSKIRNAEDLLSISSMGFRGEALASIAAVSRVEMITKTAAEDEGSRVIIEGGNIGNRQDYGCPTGTSIIVRDLFFNTPARYKFLKKDYTEAGYIEDVITMLALGNPGISFKFINNKNLIIQAPGNGDINACAYSIFGNIVKSTLKVDYEQESVKVTGLAGKPEVSRSNRSQQIFFINNRIIKNKTITSAVEEAYKTLLQVGKYPFIILNINVNPNLVDINVHPTKQEVRFSDENLIFSTVYHAVKNALLNTESLIRDYSTDITGSKAPEFGLASQSKSSAFNPSSNIQSSPQKSIFRFGLESGSSGNNYYKSSDKYEPHFDNITKSAGIPENYSDKNPKEEKVSEAKIDNHILEPAAQYIPFKVIGSAFSTYIMVEMNDDLYIIDQHAAHERVMYEKLKKDSEHGKELSQMLVIPEILEFKHSEFETVMRNKDIFGGLGIILDEFGTNSVKISSVPYVCGNVNVRELIDELLDGIENAGREDKSLVKDKLLYRMACKAAVKANSQLKEQEIMGLIDAMNDLDNPYTCPHGRPTTVKMSKREFEKKFGRG